MADVSAAFLQKLHAQTSLTLTLSGTLTVSSVAMTIGGEASVAASGDAYSRSTLAVGAQTLTTELTVVGDHVYSAHDLGPYIEISGGKQAIGGGLGAFLAAISAVTDKGTTTQGNEQLHHLVTPMRVAPITFGLDAPSLTGVTAGVDLYATDDGTPAMLELSADWQYDDGLHRHPVKLAMSATFGSFDGSATGNVPHTIWQVYTSKLFSISVGHPSGWKVTLSKKSNSWDTLADPEGRLLMVASWRPALSLEGNSTEWIDITKADLNATLVKVDDVYVAGVAAKLATFKIKKTGEIVHTAMVFENDGFYILELWGPLGARTPNEDLDLLTALMSTVRFPS